MSSNTVDESRMPLWEHLDELRSRLIRVVLVLIIGTAVCWVFSESIIRFLEQPLLSVLPPGEGHLYFTGIADKFFIYLQISFIGGLALSSPWLLYETWCFVAPALYRHEKRIVAPLLSMATISFVTGLVFAYTVILPLSYRFLINFGSPTDKPLITLTEYFSFTAKLLLGIGALFEFPVVIVLLAAIGVWDAEKLSKYRGYAFLVICVLAAVLTPTPDAITMTLVVIPLYLLYELSILMVRIIRRSRPAESL